jgi:hypothetical protein
VLERPDTTAEAPEVEVTSVRPTSKGNRGIVTTDVGKTGF